MNSKNLPHMLRLALLAAVMCGAVAAAMASATDKRDVHVRIEQISDATLSITYDFDRPQREIILSQVADGYRQQRWRIETRGFLIAATGDEDRIFREDGARFDHVTLTARPHADRLPKEYQPIAAYGEGGALVYTGHFWPMTKRGGRSDAVFTFIPAKGGETVAFGARAQRLENWRSPTAHPAFVYMGPLEPVETDQVMALVDTSAPSWVIDEFYAMTPASFGYLANAFGFSPETRPNLFLAAPLGDDEGRLSYAGDALPGQFQITLEGGGWREASVRARSLFRRSTIHEAVHLWQAAAARPDGEHEAAWIHEGGADAVAAEAMVALGYWGAGELAAFESEVRGDCAKELRMGSLSGAEARGDYKAVYACGYYIARASAQALDMTAAEFWHAFMDEAGRGGGYSEEAFYDFVEAGAGDGEFVTALRHFVRTPLAKPDREIGRLMKAAG